MRMRLGCRMILGVGGCLDVATTLVRGSGMGVGCALAPCAAGALGVAPTSAHSSSTLALGAWVSIDAWRGWSLDAGDPLALAVWVYV
jgi:hypothetical protein